MFHRCFSLFVLLVAVIHSGVLAADSAQRKTSLLYVATYSPKEGEGILVATFDCQTGAIGTLRPTGGLQTTATLVLHPRGNWLYATTQGRDSNGKPTGAVAAFSVDATTGELKEIDRRLSGGTGPCYLAVDGEGRCLVVANCGTATVACLKLRPDGRFGDSSTIIPHEGTSQNSEGKPQAHSILIAPNNRFAIAADLGLDRVFVYRLEADHARLTPSNPPFVPVPRGAGPRHVAFHPGGRFAYSVNELDNTVTAFSFQGETGVLQAIDNVTTLPDDFRGESYAAEIQVDSAGRFLYASNRGHESLAMYSIDPQTGRLSRIGHASSGGKFPRHFTPDTAGQFLVVANQKSDQLAVFRVDPDTGRLKTHGEPFTVPLPVCVRILKCP